MEVFRIFGTIDLESSEVDKKLKEVEQNLQNSAKRMKDIGGTLSRNVTAPILGLGAGILKVAGDFEASMQRVKANVNGGIENFDALEDKARQLGATTQFSANQAADAIDMLGRNSLNADQILDGALDATLQLAAATDTDLANAANIATDAMFQFNLQASDLNDVVNTISGTTVNSKFSIDDFMFSLANAGGVAGKIGLSFEDFATTVAAISPAFGSGRDAATSLKVMLTRLTPTTDATKQAFEELGLTAEDGSNKLFDTQGNLKSMSEVTQVLNESLGELTAQQKIVAAQTIFGTDAMRAGLALAGTSANDYLEILRTGLVPTTQEAAEAAEELGLITAQGNSVFLDAQGNLVDVARATEILDEAFRGLTEAEKEQRAELIFGNDAMIGAIGLTKTAGESFDELYGKITGNDAAEQARLRMEGLQGELKKLKSALGELAIAIAKSGLLEWATNAVTKLTNFISKLGEANPQLLKWGSIIALVAATVGPFLLVLGQLLATFALLPKLLVTTGGGLGKFGGAAKGATGGAGKLGAKLTPLGKLFNVLEKFVLGAGKALLFFLNPFKALKVIFQPVVTGITKFNTSIKTMGGGIKGIGGVIANLVKNFKGFGLTILNLVKSGAPLKGLLLGLRGGLTLLGGPIGLIITTISLLVSAWQNDFGNIRKVTSDVIGNITRQFQVFREAIAPMVQRFQEAFNKIKEVFSGADKKIGEINHWKVIFESVFEAIGNVIETAVGIALALITGFIDGISQAVELIANLLQGNFKAAFDNVVGIVATFISTILNMFVQLPGMFGQSAKNVVQGFIDGIVNKLAAARETIQNFAGNIVAWFRGGLREQSPSRITFESGQNFALGFVNGLKSMQGEVSEEARETAQKAVDAFNQALSDIDAQLNIGFLEPKEAKQALEGIKQGLKQTIAEMISSGQATGEVFTGVVAQLDAVESKLQEIDQTTLENIKSLHGITEATTMWLDKLTAQAELGLRPLTDIFDELKTRRDEILASIQELQSGGLTQAELPIFSALVEKFNAVDTAYQNVSSKIEELANKEKEAAQELIDSGELTVQERVNQLEARISNTATTVGELKILEDELVEHRKTLSEEEKQIDQALFDLRKTQGEVSLQEEIARLEQAIAKERENSLEQIALRQELADKQQELLAETTAIEDAQLELRKAKGQATLEDELALLQRRLAAHQGNVQERLQLEQSIVEKQKEIKQRDIAEEQARLNLKKSMGEASLEDELNFLQRQLAAHQGNALEKINLQQQIFDKSEEIRQRDIALDQAMFDLRKHLGQTTLEEELLRLQSQLDATEANSAERIALEQKVFDKRQEIRQRDIAEEQARIGLLAAQGQDVLQAELALLQRRLQTFEGLEQDRLALVTEIANKEKEIRASDFASRKQTLDLLAAQGRQNHDAELQLLKEMAAEQNISDQERLARMTAVAQKEQEIINFNNDLESKRVELKKAQGEDVLNYELALLQRRLANETDNEQARLQLQIEIAAKQKEIRDSAIANEKARLDFLRAMGEATLQDELNRIQTVLERTDLSVEQRRALLLAEQETKNEIATQELAKIEEVFEEKKRLGETSLDDHIAMLEKQLEVDNLRPEQIKEINDKILDLEEQKKEDTEALEEALFNSRKLKGDVSLQDEIDRLEKSLENHEGDKLAKQKILDEIFLKEQEQDKKKRALDQALFEFELKIGQKTLNDKLRRLLTELGEVEKGSLEEIRLKKLVHETAKQIGEEAKQDAQALNDFRREQGEISLQEHLNNLKEKQEGNEKFSEEWLKTQKEINDTEAKLRKENEDVWKTVMKGVIDVSRQIAKAVGGKTGEAIDKLADLTQDAMNIISAFSKGIVSGIVAVVSTAVKWIIDSFDRSTKKSKAAAEEIKGLQEDIKFLEIDLKRFTEKAVDVKFGFAGPILVEFDRLKKGYKELLLTFDKGVGSGLKKGMKGFLRGVIGAGGVLENLKTAIRSAIEDAIIQAVIQGAVVKGALSKPLADLTAALAEGKDPSAIIKDINNQLPVLTKRLVNVLTPLKKGLDNAFGKTKDETEKVARDFQDKTVEDIDAKIKELTEARDRAKEEFHKESAAHNKRLREKGYSSATEKIQAEARFNIAEKDLNEFLERAKDAKIKILVNTDLDSIDEIDKRLANIEKFKLELGEDAPKELLEAFDKTVAELKGKRVDLLLGVKAEGLEEAEQKLQDLIALRDSGQSLTPEQISKISEQILETQEKILELKQKAAEEEAKATETQKQLKQAQLDLEKLNADLSLATEEERLKILEEIKEKEEEILELKKQVAEDAKQPAETTQSTTTTPEATTSTESTTTTTQPTESTTVTVDKEAAQKKLDETPLEISVTLNKESLDKLIEDTQAKIEADLTLKEIEISGENFEDLNQNLGSVEQTIANLDVSINDLQAKSQALLSEQVTFTARQNQLLLTDYGLTRSTLQNLTTSNVGLQNSNTEFMGAINHLSGVIRNITPVSVTVNATVNSKEDLDGLSSKLARDIVSAQNGQ